MQHILDPAGQKGSSNRYNFFDSSEFSTTKAGGSLGAQPNCFSTLSLARKFTTGARTSKEQFQKASTSFSYKWALCKEIHGKEFKVSLPVQTLDFRLRDKLTKSFPPERKQESELWVRKNRGGWRRRRRTLCLNRGKKKSRFHGTFVLLNDLF